MLTLFAMKVLIALDAVKRELRDELGAEQGQGLIEYVLILFLFVIGLIVTLQGLGDVLSLKYADIAQAFPVAP